MKNVLERLYLFVWKPLLYPPPVPVRPLLFTPLRCILNLGAVCNATTLARAVKFPKGTVDMSDGRFEVILIAVPQTPLELQETLTALRTRDYERCRAIDFFHAAALRVECAADLELTLDGEQVTGLSEAEVSVLPGAMHLACP